MPPSLTFVSDSSPAGWVVASLTTFDHSVGSIVPRVFPAYCRLFHPARRVRRGPGDLDRGYDTVRWTDIATARSLHMHAEVQFETLDPHESLRNTVWDEPPDTGHLPVEIKPALTTALRRHCHGADCWYLVWEGWGGLRRPQGIEPLEVPGRRYYLARGPIEAIVRDGFDEIGAPGPSVWWPEGREWCVSTDIDLRSTYVGATQECVEALTQEAELEALPATVDDDITITSDRLNFGG